MIPTHNFRVLFKRPDSPLSHFICWLTRSQWSHVALHWANEGLIYELAVGRKGLWYDEDLFFDANDTKGEDWFEDCTLLDIPIDILKGFPSRVVSQIIDTTSITTYWLPWNNCIHGVCSVLKGLGLDTRQAPKFSTKNFYLWLEQQSTKRARLEY